MSSTRLYNKLWRDRVMKHSSRDFPEAPREPGPPADPPGEVHARDDEFEVSPVKRPAGVAIDVAILRSQEKRPEDEIPPEQDLPRQDRELHVATRHTSEFSGLKYPTSGRLFEHVGKKVTTTVIRMTLGGNLYSMLADKGLIWQNVRMRMLRWRSFKE